MPRKQSAADKSAPAAARSREKYAAAPPRRLDAVNGAGAPDSAANSVGRAGLEHRNPMPHPPEFRPFRGTGLFERIGGLSTIDILVDTLYDGIDSDADLRPLFPRDLAHDRSMVKLFFAEWLGGPRLYSEQAHAGLRQRHDDVPITSERAERWLLHFRHAIAVSVADENDRATIFAHVRSLALNLVNLPDPAGTTEPDSGWSRDDGEAGAHDGGAQVAWCGSDARVLTRARQLAHRGDAQGLETVLAEAPDLLRPSFAAAIMQSAALAGRADIVRMLLGLGVGADGAFYLPVNVVGLAFERVVFATPLCVARMKRRTAVESVLSAAGAHEDVFTSAFLGDVPALERMLADDAGLAAATDPMVDVIDITPVEHAVAGGQTAALQLLLDQVSDPGTGYVRALRGAAAQENLAMVDLLLAAGADATRIGVGRWVLHPQLAPLLAAHGAAIDSTGSWIGDSCTGNQGRKDDPDYVRALLRHGAKATDRRIGDPGQTTGVEALNATALHFAAKAGFVETVKVLLEHGADPAAQDSRGRTPLDWLDQAAPSVSRKAVRDLICWSG